MTNSLQQSVRENFEGTRKSFSDRVSGNYLDDAGDGFVSDAVRF